MVSINNFSPRKFKSHGYTVNLLFLGLSSPNVSELRVNDRAKEGGHWVDRSTIEDYFYGNFQKLEQHIDAVHNIHIIDTTQFHTALAHFTNGEVVSAIPYAELPEWFTKYLPKLSQKIKEASPI